MESLKQFLLYRRIKYSPYDLMQIQNVMYTKFLFIIASISSIIISFISIAYPKIRFHFRVKKRSASNGANYITVHAFVRV